VNDHPKYHCVLQTASRGIAKLFKEILRQWVVLKIQPIANSIDVPADAIVIAFPYHVEQPVSPVMFSSSLTEYMTMHSNPLVKLLQYYFGFPL